MARVEWTRLSGDEVEAVVAMLICSLHPNAVRVRPSQGDGGIDVFVPGEAGFAQQRAVYQVKKFAANLTASQKRKIKGSYTRLLETAADEGWEIVEWHLVMPLDLTSQNLGWLDDVTTSATFPCETNGLLFCDTMAANYPKIIDYYLRDGRERLEGAMNTLASIIAGRADRQLNEPLGAADVVSDIASIHKALNESDPFYHYDFAVSEKPPANERTTGQDGLVAVYGVRQDSAWISFSIFALSLAALQERPISGQFTVMLPPEDDMLRKQFEKFIDYGAPIAMPPGTVSGTLDLPGGLGGDISGASLQVLGVPPQDDDSDPAELLLAIVAPDSEAVIASTVIRRTELSAGQAGLRSVFSDTAGLFKLEMLVQDGAFEGTMNLGVEYDLAGRRPAELVDSLKLLGAWHAPNRLAFGLTYGPPDYGVVATVPSEHGRDPDRWGPICDALARIQQHVAVLLKMPRQMERDQAIAILEAGKLVSGEPVTSTISGRFTVTHQGLPELKREPDTVYEFWYVTPVEIELEDTTITVGKQARFFLGRFVEIEADRSVIEPVTGEAVSFRYAGDLDERHLMGRQFVGSVAERPTTDEPEAPPNDEVAI
ncbi:MAG: hypothetical protein JWL96_4656 [Sphingomonas bacterium]|uniref:hypothetical protein n=1 Tax=Sphingomonas bacterium TaxID=1895847 RepID=UPI0026216A98|nr:hypothetical protein [Sphingomonas bacterium]MDB5712586.1 hypothetical protein [Sphingomonas bacterium]